MRVKDMLKYLSNVDEELELAAINHDGSACHDVRCLQWWVMPKGGSATEAREVVLVGCAHALESSEEAD